MDGVPEDFLERAFAQQRLRVLLSSSPRPGDLVRFHSRHKLQLMAYSPGAYAKLGRLVARAGSAPIDDTATEYGRVFTAALQETATRGRHVNVLQHMAGYFRGLLASDERRQLADAIDDYRMGIAPRAVAVRLIAHHTRQHAVEYLADQAYLEPYPHRLAPGGDG